MENEFPLPIYLNQKYVFDLLAIVENGFSIMETIKTEQIRSDNEKGTVKSSLTINPLDFIKVIFSAKLESEAETKTNQATSKEKVHTPNSLFSKLRTYLYKQQIIKTSKFLNLVPGEFVEFKLSLKKNPLIDYLESFHSMMKMAVLFEVGKPAQHQQGKANKHQTQQQNKIPNKQILDQIEALIKQLKTEGSIDLIGSSTDTEKFRVVLTLDSLFISDSSLSDIADGSFTVLGKVTRVIKDGSGESVNLLRKTSLSKLNNEIIESVEHQLSGLEQFGFAIDGFETQVTGDVIQIIPIAIFA